METFDPTLMVQLLDHMGSDLRVINSARVSYAKESHEVTPKDHKLISYLAKHHHITPFFHPQICFRLKMPIFVAREWFRHTVGLARNEMSRRYVDDPPTCMLLTPENVRPRAPSKKQGSNELDPHPNALQLSEIMNQHCRNSIELYNHLIQQQVAPEVARQILPQNMYTEFVETGSLAAYIRICKLRNDPAAQQEIRTIASHVASILQQLFPVSWNAHFPPEESQLVT
jgi:thymidylate synthase (FAD)